MIPQGTLRRSLASDADEGAAWFASPAVFGLESQFPAGDANEMDESSASLTGNGMKLSGKTVWLRLLIAKAEAALELIFRGELLLVSPEVLPEIIE